MNNTHQSNLARIIVLSLCMVTFNLPVYADFLEMPDVKQSPELKNKSLLRDMDIPAVKFRSPRAGPHPLDKYWTTISAFLHHEQQALERSNETKET